MKNIEKQVAFIDFLNINSKVDQKPLVFIDFLNIRAKQLHTSQPKRGGTARRWQKTMTGIAFLAKCLKKPLVFLCFEREPRADMAKTIGFHIFFEEMFQKPVVFPCFERELPRTGSDLTPPALQQIRQNLYRKICLGNKSVWGISFGAF